MQKNINGVSPRERAKTPKASPDLDKNNEQLKPPAKGGPQSIDVVHEEDSSSF